MPTNFAELCPVFRSFHKSCTKSVIGTSILPNGYLCLMDTCSNHLHPTTFAGKCRAFRRVFLLAMTSVTVTFDFSSHCAFSRFLLNTNVQVTVQLVAQKLVSDWPLCWVQRQWVLHQKLSPLGIVSLVATQWFKQCRNTTPREARRPVCRHNCNSSGLGGRQCMTVSSHGDRHSTDSPETGPRVTELRRHWGKKST